MKKFLTAPGVHAYLLVAQDGEEPAISVIDNYVVLWDAFVYFSGIYSVSWFKYENPETQFIPYNKLIQENARSSAMGYHNRLKSANRHGSRYKIGDTSEHTKSEKRKIMKQKKLNSLIWALVLKYSKVYCYNVEKEIRKQVIKNFGEDRGKIIQDAERTIRRIR